MFETISKLNTIAAKGNTVLIRSPTKASMSTSCCENPTFSYRKMARAAIQPAAAGEGRPLKKRWLSSLDLCFNIETGQPQNRADHVEDRGHEQDGIERRTLGGRAKLEQQESRGCPEGNRVAQAVQLRAEPAGSV